VDTTNADRFIFSQQKIFFPSHLEIRLPTQRTKARAYPSMTPETDEASSPVDAVAASLDGWWKLVSGCACPAPERTRLETLADPPICRERKAIATPSGLQENTQRKSPSWRAVKGRAPPPLSTEQDTFPQNETTSGLEDSTVEAKWLAIKEQWKVQVCEQQVCSPHSRLALVDMPSGGDPAHHQP